MPPPPGVVVLGPSPGLLRDILRSLLEPEPTLVVVETEPAGEAAGRVVARVLIAAREDAARVAESTGESVPVVVVSPDGRWAGRFVGGRLEGACDDTSASDIVRLVAGGERSS